MLLVLKSIHIHHITSTVECGIVVLSSSADLFPILLVVVWARALPLPICNWQKSLHGSGGWGMEFPT